MIWETGEAEEWIDKEKELYFYSNLEALMAEKGLSIAELSGRTGVAQSTIRSLIRGRLKRLDSISTGRRTLCEDHLTNTRWSIVELERRSLFLGSSMWWGR